jgi:hypothetical protein
MASRARLENIVKKYQFGRDEFNGPTVTDRLLSSAFALDPETIDDVWTKYGKYCEDQKMEK